MLDWLVMTITGEAGLVVQGTASGAARGPFESRTMHVAVIDIEDAMGPKQVLTARVPR